MAGRIGAYWGVIGVCMLLMFAVYRLTVIALDSFKFSFLWYHWLIFVANILFMAHSEGYKGFQKAFSPRVAARARYLKFNPNPIHIMFAPLFCMGYFHTTRKRLIITYALTLGIVMLVIIFNQISQPWRGIFDAGVVVGLSWGVISIIIYFIRAMVRDEFEFSAEVPMVEAD
jgi:hypothetical protein